VVFAIAALVLWPALGEHVARADVRNQGADTLDVAASRRDALEQRIAEVGGKGPSKCVDNTIRFLRGALPAVVQPPSVASLPDASAISLDWRHGERELIVEIGAGDEFSALLVKGGVDIKEQSFSGVDALKALTRWLKNGQPIP
jgi:hypothetical protein